MCRWMRARAIYSGDVHPELKGASGTAYPALDSDDPESPYVGLWLFWRQNSQDPVLVRQADLISLDGLHQGMGKGPQNLAFH